MKERPILFKGPMILAILDGRKTMTRRVVLKNQQLDSAYDLKSFDGRRARFQANRKPRVGELLMPSFGVNARAEVGDQLWVKETFSPQPQLNAKAFYKASDPLVGCKWIGSIYMPRRLSRIMLEVTGVRVERLQEISEADAKSEGSPMWVPGHGEVTTAEVNADPGYSNFISYRLGFEMLWESINSKRAPWKSNPWVWVVSFKKL